MPSRFVTPSAPRVPEKTCVGKTDAGVKPKYAGTVLTLMRVAVETPVGRAMRRDQRRVTTSAVAVAMIRGVAAGKAVAGRATGRHALPSCWSGSKTSRGCRGVRRDLWCRRERAGERGY